MKKKIWISVIALGLIVLCISSCGKKKNNTVQLVLPVETTTPTFGAFSVESDYVANLEPVTSALLMPMINGEVTDVYVKAGDIVEEGDVLCIIDDEDIADQLETAQLSRSRAQTSHDTMLDSMQVKAPVSGYVRAIDQELGVSVSPSTQLAYLSDNDSMTIEIPFLAVDVDNTWIGCSAELVMVDTGEKLEGIITEISGDAQFIHGNVQANVVSIEVKNQGALQAGRMATATVNGVTCCDTGFFEAASDSPVMAGLAGTLDECYVHVGDYVTAGQVMFLITNASMQGQLNNASNALTDANKRCDDLAELMDDYKVKAPFAGQVAYMTVSEYENISASTVVGEIHGMDGLSVSFFVSEKTRNKLSLDQSILVEVKGQQVQGAITEISGSADVKTGLFIVKGVVTDFNDELLPGTTAKITLTSFLESEVLQIPYDAVHFQGDEAFVYIVKEGFATKVSISTGEFDDENIVVTDGLSGDEVVISSWSSQLREGIPVEIREAENEAN